MNKELLEKIASKYLTRDFVYQNGLDINGAKEIAKLCSKAACEAVEESDYHFIVGEDMRPYVDAYKVVNKIKQALEGSDEKEGVV